MVTSKPLGNDDCEVDSATLIVEVLSSTTIKSDRVDWRARTVEAFQRDGMVLRRSEPLDTLDLGHGISIETTRIFEDLQCPTQ